MENELTLKRFTDVRRELGYTQADFAALLGVSNTTADIERGRTKLSGKVVSELPLFWFWYKLAKLRVLSYQLLQRARRENRLARGAELRWRRQGAGRVPAPAAR